MNDERGAVLEAVVSRMKTLSCSPATIAKGWPASRMRIVALSATLPNLSDLAAWIEAPREATFSFDASFRPVRLQHHVLGFDNKTGGECEANVHVQCTARSYIPFQHDAVPINECTG